MISNERQINHWSLVVDYLTKSYDNFKKYKNSRMTIVLASLIANAYVSAQKYDHALRFYDRIVKSYRKEKWYLLLGECLKMIGDCSINLGPTLIYYESLFEQLHRSVTKESGLQLVHERLEYVFKSSTEAIIIDMTKLLDFILCEFQFQAREAKMKGYWQLLVSLKSCHILPPSMKLKAIVVNFSNARHNHKISCSDEFASMQLIPGNAKLEGDVFVDKCRMDFQEFSTIVYQGVLEPSENQEIAATLLSLIFETSGRDIQLDYLPSHRFANLRRQWLVDNPIRWIEMGMNDQHYRIRFGVLM